MPRKSMLANRLMQVAAMLTLAASIMALFSGQNRFFELASHFRVQYLFISFLCVALLLIFKNYKYCVSAFIALSINAACIFPWYFSNENHKGIGQEPLKLLQSNVHTNNISYTKYIEFVNSQSPDILIVQEVNTEWMKNLDILKGSYPFVVSVPSENNFGIAVFSKHPFIENQIIEFGQSGVPSIKVSLKLRERTFILIATHPLPPISTSYFETRNSQLAAIANFVHNLSEPVIVIGDLNVTMWSSYYSSFEEVSGLINSRKGFGVLPTWPVNASFLSIPIDHCLVSKEFNVENVTVGSDIGSDHYPLVVSVSFK